MLETSQFRFSLRLLFAFSFLVAIIVLVIVEYGGMARVDGGGKQKVLLNISDSCSVTVLRYSPVRQNEDIENVKTALAARDLQEVHRLAPFPHLVGTIKPFKEKTELIVDQNWSHTSMGLTNPRHYVQTFSNLVIYVKRDDGSASHHVIALPKYGRATQLDLPKVE